MRDPRMSGTHGKGEHCERPYLPTCLFRSSGGLPRSRHPPRLDP